MITRSKRDASYTYIELPEPKRKRQNRQEPIVAPTVKPTVAPNVAPTVEPNITIAYYEWSPRPPLYEVNIDFDEAHAEWVKNKVKLKNGCYRYKKYFKKGIIE